MFNLKKLFILLGVLMMASCSSGSNSGTKPENLEALSTFKDEVRDYRDNNISTNDKLDGVEQIQAADPFVLRFNGMYYLYVTSGGNQCHAWKSKDLINWKKVQAKGLPEGVVFKTPSNIANPWAPEVRYFNGKFYFISSFSGKKHCILQADSPEGPFNLVTPNGIGTNCIDGSFFIDSDEQIYTTIASTGGILVKKMKDDFSDFKSSKFDTYYKNTKLGRWNEGPYITKRFNSYYLTWTGVDCYAPSYRVNYNFYDGKSVDNIFNSMAFEQQGGSLLLKTDEEYKGLGHSANFLGPDLDSYYVGYHNLKLNYSADGTVVSNRRYFNYARLSFNGSSLVSDSYDLTNNFVPRRPEFETENASGLLSDSSILLSEKASEKDFSCEFNLIGKDSSPVFSYVDENNYCELKINDNSILINQIKDGNSATLFTIALNKTYDFSKLHTYRINYGNDRLSFYFDDIEKLSEEGVNLTGGKIGYKNALAENVFYTAFSNVGGGTSDKEEYQINQSLANQFDEDASLLRDGSGLSFIDSDDSVISYKSSNNLVLKNRGDRGTYRTYFDEGGKVKINVALPKSMSGKKIGVRINDGDVQEVQLDNLQLNENMYITTLGSFDVKEGRNYISIENVGDEISFNKICYLPNYFSEKQTFESSLSAYNASIKWEDHGRENIEITGDGLHAKGNDSNFAYFKNDLLIDDVTAEVEVTLKEQVTDKHAALRKGFFNKELTMDMIDLEDRYASGIAIGVNDYEYYYGGPNYDPFINSLQGLYLGINNEKIFLRDCNYNFSKNVFEEKRSFDLNKAYKLKIVKKGNLITCYLDDEKICDYVSQRRQLQGKVGMYSFFNESYYKNLKIEK